MIDSNDRLGIALSKIHLMDSMAEQEVEAMAMAWAQNTSSDTTRAEGTPETRSNNGMTCNASVQCSREETHSQSDTAKEI
jgi:hypothetical protein